MIPSLHTPMYWQPISPTYTRSQDDLVACRTSLAVDETWARLTGGHTMSRKLPSPALISRSSQTIGTVARLTTSVVQFSTGDQLRRIEPGPHRRELTVDCVEYTVPRILKHRLHLFTGNGDTATSSTLR